MPQLRERFSLTKMKLRGSARMDWQRFFTLFLVPHDGPGAGQARRGFVVTEEGIKGAVLAPAPRAKKKNCFLFLICPAVKYAHPGGGFYFSFCASRLAWVRWSRCV